MHNSAILEQAVTAFFTGVHCNQLLASILIIISRKRTPVVKITGSQQVQPDSSCLSGTGVSLRMTSVISSFLGSVDSMPGRAAATRLKSCFTLFPALAEVSMNITFNSFAFLSPSSVETCLLSDRSVLFPTSIMITSLPLSVLTSSIHLLVWWKELALVMS